MKLKLYNTLTRKKETFKPIKPKNVNMYTCGPTVYWYQHIGNLRAYIFSDLLKRVLEYNKFKIRHVINITDVGHLTSDSDLGEDKIENAAKKEGKTAQEVSNFYFKIFEKDFEKLNILSPNIWSKATDHIKDMISLIKRLEKKSYTYETSDGVYFDSSKFKNYGKLAKINVKGLEEGKRVAKGEKKNKTDFALWKFSRKGEKRQQEWESPWGVGFPGWHIECSAMSMKHLGENFDIHTGGEDHIHIHHTNEIAQSEAATGKKFVNYWLHESFLLSKGQKVSKSKGGLYTISELEKIDYKPEHFRYLNLLTHYRKPLNFSLDNLDSAKKAYDRISRKVSEIRNEKHKGKDFSKEYEKRFLSVINDDLNIPNGVQVFLEVLDEYNFEPKKKLRLLEKFDSVLGLGIKKMVKKEIEIPNKVKKLIESRERLRKNKMWAEADVIRRRIQDEGYTVEDTSNGSRIEKLK